MKFRKINLQTHHMATLRFLFFCLERPFNAVYFISSFSENCQPLGSFRCFYIFKQLNLHYFVKYKSLPSMMCSALLPLEKRFPKPLYIPYEVNVLGWYAEKPVRPCSRDQAIHIGFVFVSNVRENGFLKIKILDYLSPCSTNILHINIRLLLTFYSLTQYVADLCSSCSFYWVNYQ